MNRAGLLMIVAAAIVTTSCAAGSRPTAAPGARAVAAGPAVYLAAPASCPVTRPMSHATPPPRLHAVDDVTFYVPGWYGNSALWVGVPVHGVLPAVHPYGTPWASEWGTKLPWWPAIRGTLTITARRLDGPSAGFHSETAEPAYAGKARIIPSGLIWPAPGCWQVTGTIAGHSLTFVTWVAATGP